MKHRGRVRALGYPGSPSRSATRWRQLRAAATVALAMLMVTVGPTLCRTAERPAAHAELPPHLGYGMNVRQETSVESLYAPLEFDWIKPWEEYEEDPPSTRLPYNVLFALQCPGAPSDLAAWGDHIEAIATRGLGFVEAYEIGNEPNLDRFWGGAPPDPSEYVAALRVAYRRIKAVDPRATVVSGGLAPVGRIGGTCNGWKGNNCAAMDEREYAREMMRHGAGYFLDAFGYHPYGFAYAPETDPDTVSNGFAFRGAEVVHDIMVDHGFGEKPIWATEFGWLRSRLEDGDALPEWCKESYLSGFGWMEVSEGQQASHLVRAFEYADANWPWLETLFVWNLDWHTYHTWDCEPARYFSLRKHDGSTEGEPSAAYGALAEMEKRGQPRLASMPDSLGILAELGEPRPYRRRVVSLNVGQKVLSWTACISPGTSLTPSIDVASGFQGSGMVVTLDTTALGIGTYTGGITITAVATDALDSPLLVPISVKVIPDVHRRYLPIGLRRY